ncbi:MAG: Maf family protein [Paracoccaceae bacterium]
MPTTPSAATPRPRLVLGSASRRRLDLLAQIGFVPGEVRAAELDEAPFAGEVPRAYCLRVAREKADALSGAARLHPSALPDPASPLTKDGDGEVLLCADTTVAIGRRILGKPGDEAEARRFLTALSGRRHRVLTAVVVRRGARSWERVVETTVKVRALTEGQIAAYLASGEWRGKAGGYAIQGRFGAHVTWLQGSFSGVVGLPLAETAGLLDAAGLSLSAQEEVR